MAVAIQHQRTGQKAGTAAIVAILLAIGSFIATFTGNPVWGAIAALVAIVAGAIGLASAASPRVSGGVMSIAAIALAVFGLGISVLGMIGAIVF